MGIHEETLDFLQYVNSMEDRPAQRWEAIRDHFIQVMGEDPGTNGACPNLVRDVAAYKMQIMGYMTNGVEVPLRVQQRFDANIQQWRRVKMAVSQVEKIREINAKLSTPALAEGVKKRFQAQLKALVSAVKGWKIDDKTGMAVETKPAADPKNVKLKKSGVDLKPRKSAEDKKAEREAQFAEWERQGGKRITVPAHDEKGADGVIRHHAEYSYVMPPKPDAAKKEKASPKKK